MPHWPVFTSAPPRTAASAARAGEESTLSGLLRRSEPIRTLLISLSALALGLWLWELFLPCLPAATREEILMSHLPTAAAHPLLSWLRLSAARAPVWLLFSVAGLTRFSGGLTSGLLLYRGVCDGMALRLLFASEAPKALWVVFTLWCLLDLAIRLACTRGARRMAACHHALAEADGRMDEATRRVLWQYATFCLMTLTATLLACGIYTVLLRLI